MPPVHTSDARNADLDVAQSATEPAERHALRAGCGLLDRSERGKLALTGAGAAAFLNGQVTNDVEELQVGEGCYAVFLTHKGKMLGDLRVLRTEDELLLDTERVALQALFDMIRRFKIGYDVELHKRTLERGLLSLIGPRAREIAAAAAVGTAPSAATAGTSLSAAATAGTGAPAAATAAALPPAVEHSHSRATIAGRPARLIATALPEGLDVLCDARHTDQIKSALLAAGAEPVSDAAAETLRVEQGVPRFGVDVEPEGVIPQEAGLNERAVSFTKGCYVGQETVARLYYRGKPNRHLRGLLLKQSARTGEQIKAGERVVGALGSVAVSPALGPIALALVRREVEPGAAVSVGESGVAAEVVELPFPGHR
jgi:folate-binding protein YgfZ